MAHSPDPAESADADADARPDTPHPPVPSPEALRAVADYLDTYASDVANGSRDFGRGFSLAITMLRIASDPAPSAPPASSNEPA